MLRESSQRATATLAHLCRELHGAATAVSRTGDQLGDGRRGGGTAGREGIPRRRRPEKRLEALRD